MRLIQVGDHEMRSTQVKLGYVRLCVFCLAPIGCLKKGRTTELGKMHISNLLCKYNYRRLVRLLDKPINIQRGSPLLQQ